MDTTQQSSFSSTFCPICIFEKFQVSHMPNLCKPWGKISLRMTNKVAFWGKKYVCSDCKSWVGTLSDWCDSSLWNAKQMFLGWLWFLCPHALMMCWWNNCWVFYVFAMIQSACAHNLSQCIIEILIPNVLF